MSKYTIKTIDSQGTSQEDVIEAPDQAAVYALIKQRGATLISVEEEKEKKGIFQRDLPFFGKVKMADKIFFTRNLGSMIEAGLSMSRALAVIEKQTKHKKFKTIVSDLGRSIGQGETLSGAMKVHPDVFPQLLISMVKAGEESGSLAQSLKIVAAQMESSYNLTKKVRGALMYPAVILFAMIIIGFFMMTYVVPILSKTFKELNAELPIQTKIVIGLSDFLAANIVSVLIGLAIAVIVLYFGKKTGPGKRFMDWLMLHIPVIGPLIKEVNSARTSRTLASLLSSGVDVVVAIQITRDVVQNSYYKDVLSKVEERIQKGEPIATIFNANEHLYPVFVGEMISVGEETGQLAQMLQGVAVFYENDIDQKTKDMSSIIEPFLMIVIGLAVGFFAISMIGPIYSLSNNI